MSLASAGPWLLIFLLLMAFIIFLLLREVNCWYLKINERLKIEKENNQLLKQILAALSNDKPSLNDTQKK